MASPERHFGSIRKRASGRYQVRYPVQTARSDSAPDLRAQDRRSSWLSVKETEITRGDWINPDAGQAVFADYSAQWMKDRVLKPRTRELYRGLLRNHLLPAFGSMALADFTLAGIRRWRKERHRRWAVCRPARSGRSPWPRHTASCMPSWKPQLMTS